MIYLDNAATTYPKPEAVYKAMDDANRTLAFNAGRGSYKTAKQVAKLIDETKTLILKLVNADSHATVAFTPSITIALNEIIQGLELMKGDNVYVSPYEHNAVARVCNLIAERNGVNIIQLPLDADTLEIDIEKMKYMFSQKRPKAVCCVHVSNVTGYILPVAEIFTAARKYDAVTVLDTAQSLGLIAVDSRQLAADYIAFAGHKVLYGPMGIGGIISTSDRVKLDVIFAGGTGSDSLNLNMPEKVPERYEYSSPNIVAIAGLKAALIEVMKNLKENYEYEKKLTEELVKALRKIDKVTLYTPAIENHISIVSFNVEGYSAEDVGEILDQDYEIAVRTGYHCAPFIHEYLKNEKSTGTVRIGVGQFTTEEDINNLIDAINEL